MNISPAIWNIQREYSFWTILQSRFIFVEVIWMVCRKIENCLKGIKKQMDFDIPTTDFVNNIELSFVAILILIYENMVEGAFNDISKDSIVLNKRICH